LLTSSRGMATDHPSATVEKTMKIRYLLALIGLDDQFRFADRCLHR
jgi:hypothetical protein